MKIGLEYLLMQSGPMSMAPSQLGAFAKSDAQQASANLQYHVQPLSLEKFGDPLHAFPAFTASVCNLRPTSRGHVRLGSTDHALAPRITTNYLSTEEDLKVAANALRLTRRIAASPALRVIAPRNTSPARSMKVKPICIAPPVMWAPPSSIRSAPAAWAAAMMRWPWSTPNAGCAACQD
jgi:choline dehydrogenase